MKFYPLAIAFLLSLSCNKQAVTTVQTDAGTGNAVTASTILFSGYTWNVRNSNNKIEGPGKNRWNPQDIWVDSNGNLHLKIRKDTATGKWYCAEVSTKKTFRYGTYQFWVEGAIDKFDRNTVLGLFNYSGADGYDEMDIEFARWGNNAWPNLNYTIYPAQDTAGIYSYTQEFSLTGTYTTHRFTRTATSVRLQSLHGFTNTNINQFALQTCTNPPYGVSTLAMPVFINLWLFQGHAPSDGKEVEIIVHKFVYKP